MDDTLDALVARVRRLEHLDLARNLFHAYAAAVDEREVEPVVALFHPDAVLTNPRGTFTGAAEIAAAFRAAWELEPSHKRHFIASPGLRAEPDGRIVADAHFWFVGRAPERSVTGWGRYADVIEVGDTGARFRSKTITVHLSTDLATGWADTGDGSNAG